MTRGEWRAAVAGFLLACSVCVGLLAMNDANVTAAVKAQDAHSDSITKALIVSERERRAALKGQAAANARADLASANAEVSANRLGAIIRHVPVPAVTPDGTTTTIPMVPLSDFLTVKYAWEAERAARIHADSVTIPALERRIADADSLAASRQKAIALRDAQKSACGAKCGAAIATGVIGVLAWIANSLPP